MTSAELYAYDLLPREKYIRVLDLLPSKRMKSPIQLGLRTVRLEDPMPAENSYEALSYVWGSKKLTEHVFCSGKVINVTPNCIKALRYLRRKQETRTLWIDVICIDQTDSTGEKFHQVSVMGDVYQTASKVLIWLGDEDRRLWMSIHIYRVGLTWYWPMTFDRHGYPRFPLRRFADGSFDHPYFTRLWTLQEVTLSRRADIICRHATVPWDLDLLYTTGGSNSLSTRQFHAFYRQVLDRDVTHDFKLFGYFCRDLTNTIQQRQCSEPLDKVFGMHGVLKSAFRYAPSLPDYNKDFATVWEEFFRYLLEASHSLVFLYNVVFPIYPAYLRGRDATEQPPTAARLPSWVPPFTKGDREENPWTDKSACYDFWLWHYKPCCLLPPTVAKEPCDKGKLLVVGRRLGEVSTVSPWMVASELDTKNTLAAFMEAWTNFSTHSDHVHQFTSLFTRISGFTSPGGISRMIEFGKSGDHMRYESVEHRLKGWESLIQACQFTALAPRNCQKGDILVILDGASSELLLRPTEKAGEFLIIGRAVSSEVTKDHWHVFEKGQIDDFEKFCLV